ncbi:MAG: radical SAM/SPASM domain-containing protein [Bacteroidales bacterium]
MNVNKKPRTFMIDFEALNHAYDNYGFYSLQLEVGDKCYQGCIYCYMNAVEATKNELTHEKISGILVDSKKLGITAIEWLGGEPLIRPRIFDFMEQASELGFRNNMWTGGLPFADKGVTKKTAELCRYGLISVHASTVNPDLYEKLHPGRSKNDLKIILNGVEDLLSMGYPPEQLLNSVTFTGLQSSEDMIKTMEYFYKQYGVHTSINVYHTYLRPGYDPHDLKKFIPERKEVSAVYRWYKNLVGVKELPMNCVNKQYCSATLAVLNNGYVTPCATIREENDRLNGKTNRFKHIVEANRDYLNFKFFKDIKNLPEDCQKCPLNDECFGCRSRAFAAGKGIYGKDPRCFRFSERD